MPRGIYQRVSKEEYKQKFKKGMEMVAVDSNITASNLAEQLKMPISSCVYCIKLVTKGAKPQELNLKEARVLYRKSFKTLKELTAKSRQGSDNRYAEVKEYKKRGDSIPLSKEVSSRYAHWIRGAPEVLGENGIFSLHIYYDTKAKTYMATASRAVTVSNPLGTPANRALFDLIPPDTL